MPPPWHNQPPAGVMPDRQRTVEEALAAVPMSVQGMNPGMVGDQRKQAPGAVGG